MKLAGLVLTEHEISVPLDHARPDGEQITVFAREVAEPEGSTSRSWCSCRADRASRRAARPGRRAGPGWLDRALQDYPGADARSARHRALDARRRHRLRRLPRALPGRLDRPRRRARARGAGRRSLERPRAELRRAVRVHVPVARAGGAAGGVHDRRRARDRHADRRRVPGHLRADRGAQPPLLRALPGGPRAAAGPGRAARRRGRAAADRRPADVAPPAHARAASSA